MNAIAKVESFAAPHFEQIETRLDTEFGVLWGFMNPKPRPTFNLKLLHEARRFGEYLSMTGGTFVSGGQPHKVNYVVEASKVDGVYNLGGDLTYFREAIVSQDGGMLLDYGRACIDNV